MASTGTYIAEWFRHHLSSVVTFQKQFVDDVSEKVKEQKAQFDRHARETKERAVQLHLDELEEKYLCCVCGRGGEIREDDELVYSTYSMIELPPREMLEAAVREELADAEMSDERIKQQQRMLTFRQRRSQQSSTKPAATYDSGTSSDSSSDVSVAPSGGRPERTRKGKHQRRKHRSSQHKRAKSSSQRHVVSWPRRQREESEGQHFDYDVRDKHTTLDTSKPNTQKSLSSDNPPARSVAACSGAMAIQTSDIAVMDPDMVGPLDVRNTVYKIQHAVLHKEARVRRKSVVVHKDKGLMTIEESEIEMFSHFFQRPVHGYLCTACYTCARRRLDTLTQQIRAILFKAEHPILRRLPAKELEALMTGNQVPTTFIQSILAVQRRWTRLTDEQRMELHRAEAGAGPAQGPTRAFAAEERARGTSQENDATTLMTALPDESILILREEVRCGACQRRLACFFEPKSVLFLCQFCTARDRFYREHAVCINDEAMPLALTHLLQSLALYYRGTHQQMELRQAPLSAIPEAQTDLFPLTKIMRETEGLFACQAPAVANADLQGCQRVAEVEPTLSAETSTHGTEVPVARPCTSAASTRWVSGSAVPLQELRERVGRTMISLFDGVQVEGSGVNLFKNTASASSASSVSDLFQSAPVPQPPLLPKDGSSVGQGGARAAEHLMGNGSTAASAPPAAIV
ncbi:conserved hypothetical protein [Leishmania braziliensis MHOM/BR/75/M2904]|uniref:Uncharacterized protein n=2 Tax=Leishmania braziliensis TaxID=5660 RepID=A4HMN1_LEIBR|nr:conserved hypothetical protein [Leishmania braziliensis MHOM/BR/75/M2904]KAI5689281.1 hypothetical protein MNV84_07429 [Leishmania braziliensis]CAJ2480265.1 unnamed protein product [Leishmania braziliensis]CAM43419.1 conserved hypothetical protein [Leishmania braziliensis MHOM/BR/75/M2904]SYZ69492.1 hypothetical_protein [Leishmania braziliensis MHOM/BR/75/M2904]